MRTLNLLTAVAFALPLGVSAQTTTPPSGYELRWSDEFNGTSLNTTLWNIEENGNGGGNQELQYYRKENVAVHDGNLVLTARRENYNNKQFTSGRVNTRDKAYFKHGIIQARIKFPKTANGVWPAYWMMGNDYGKVGWPKCGEIDIVETGNADGIKNGTQTRHFGSTLHWGTGTGAAHKQYGTSYLAPETNPLQNDDYHIITMEWNGNFMQMFYDLEDFSVSAKNKARFYSVSIPSSTNTSDIGYYFQKPFFFIFNLAVGGNYTGIYNAGGITAMPNAGDEAKMYVDWVRVYQDSNDADAKYFTPDGNNITTNPSTPDTPEAPDTKTEYGYWGSKALDADGNSTFDFTNSYDAVLIGTSFGVTNGFSGKTTADYNVDDVKHFLYIWENTYNAQSSTGVNSFGFNESYNHYTVGSVGWSGLGYASNISGGKDLSMIDDDYVFHIGFRGTSTDGHVSHKVVVGNASFTVGNTSVEGAPIIGDFKRDGSWTYFDVPVTVLKSLAGGELFDNAANYEGNVVAILSGGSQGSDLEFDNVFFYKNPNVKKGVPTEDSTTKIGQYATKALNGGVSSFDLTNVAKAVLIGTSCGVTDALNEVTEKNYNVDEKTNFFWIWDGGDYTGLPSDGKNSFGWDESTTRLQVTGTSTWCGAGYASQGTGKDLSMIDDTWYLHFAMRGSDVLTHPSQTVTVGNAVFVIGNTTSGAPILGDYCRDGEWYNFDIPVAKLQQLAGGTLFADASNFMGNVFAVATTHSKGAEVNFDQVFFYSKKDGADTPDIPTYVTAALDGEGNSTFDLENTGNYVLIGTTGGVTTTLQKKVKADYNVDDVNSALYVWEGTMTAGSESGVNSFGYDEGGYPVYTVGTVGWSGLGYASKAQGKDMSMVDDTYYLHLGMKATTNAPYLIIVGNARFAIGSTSFVDGDKTYAPICDFPRDGKWYNLDIPYSEIASRATTVFDNPEDVTDNVVAFLAGGTTGTKLIFDQVFFYNDGSEATSIDAVTPATPNTIANNRTYTLSGIEVKGDNLPKGIYIRNGRKFIVR